MFGPIELSFISFRLVYILEVSAECYNYRQKKKINSKVTKFYQLMFPAIRHRTGWSVFICFPYR